MFLSRCAINAFRYFVSLQKLLPIVEAQLIQNAEESGSGLISIQVHSQNSFSIFQFKHLTMVFLERFSIE